MFAVQVNAKATPIYLEKNRIFICSRVCAVAFLTHYAKQRASPTFLDSLSEISKGLVRDVSPGNIRVSNTYSFNDVDDNDNSDDVTEVTAKERFYRKLGLFSG